MKSKNNPTTRDTDMKTKIREIKQYTENEIKVFISANCPLIASYLKKILETINNLESTNNKQPLTYETLSTYKRILAEMELRYKKLNTFGKDFQDRINVYKNFQSTIEQNMAVMVYKHNQQRYVI